ncbi:S8 family peptidase [Desulforamulus aeronauticus]|uniref:Subtilase family protein n=1 Tax=Desulforamulus aeronauticus DSM 10349 TaxID=1121421 RepID=A0A1M6QFC7_9FIRM|nr:S8 family peptidase [Desulforamulus aeronauticus]SHK18969.1 Subtilase family protein [Desulforamulus aeronauticus DSM 10349]
MADEGFPAKYISLRSRDYQGGKVPIPPPSPSKWLYENNRQINSHLKRLLEQIDDLLQNHVTPKVNLYVNGNRLPIPIVFKMSDRKIAKSHRPDLLLQEIETDIVAIHSIGRLIIPVTEDILYSLKEIIYEIGDSIPVSRSEWIITRKDRNGEYREIVHPQFVREYELIHELTSIEDILPYKLNDVLQCMNAQEYSNAKEDGQIKIRFFDYFNQDLNVLVFESFLKQFRPLGIRRGQVKLLNFSNKLKTYLVPYINPETIEAMASFPGVEFVSSLVRFTSNDQEKFINRQAMERLLPNKEISYPKVALVDSGISEQNKYLTPWINHKELYVPLNRQNNYHGEFIGGLLIYPHIVNPNLKNVVDTGINILDVTVMPDEKKGTIREDELIESLSDALELYSDEYKVWNLSLGSISLCSGAVSDFTAVIDELQDIYNVNFVIAAGNYSDMRDSWPVDTPFENENDRISVPADSIRGITVGAIAINGDDTTLVQEEDIVPYSRRGPGVGYSIKPDVVHYSGNPINHPIFSINTNGQVIGDFGTSYSTPLVSAILAEYYQLYPQNLSKTLSKALLIHGSRHPITNKRVNIAKDHYYFGFGLPKRLPEFLYGNEHEITMIFEDQLNYELGRNWVQIAEFPFPPSLVENDKVRGEILITLAYEPHLNPKLGSEYCRSNIDLRLITETDGNKLVTITKGSSAGEIGGEERWEKMQMTKELKWSPVKQIEFAAPRGTKGSSNVILELFPIWRDTSERTILPYVVIVTIRDPKGIAPVYSDVSNILRQSFQSSDLALKYTPTRIIGR